MTEPEADPAALSIQKVHVQIGRIRPISDRYPHEGAGKVKPAISFNVHVATIYRLAATQ